MKKISGILLVIVMLTSCVSKKLFLQSQKETASLRMDSTRLANNITSLQNNVGSLENNIVNLQKNIAEVIRSRETKSFEQRN